MEVVEEMHAIAWIAARAPEIPPQSNPAKLTRLEEPVRLTR